MDFVVRKGARLEHDFVEYESGATVPEEVFGHTPTGVDPALKAAQIATLRKDGILLLPNEVKSADEVAQTLEQLQAALEAERAEKMTLAEKLAALEVSPPKGKTSKTTDTGE